MPRRRAPVGEGRSPRSRGQSLVEFALILPVLLLLVLVAIDFGRIYLGYVNLQQMARIAAGFAADHASAFEATPPDPDVWTRYQDSILNDAEAINCTVQMDDNGQLPEPGFSGYDLGDQVEVRIDCAFGVITPIISTIIGQTLLLTGDVIYPVREGAVAEVPGGGGNVRLPPVADFFGTPQSGYGPLEVTFTDTSDNLPTSWSWNFGNGTAFSDGPHTRTYSCDPSVPPGGSCDFNVSLTVGNGTDFDTETKADYITVYVPPDTGPIADFEGTPLAAVAPRTVSFDFIDVREGSVDYSNFEWDFNYTGAGDNAWNDSGVTAISVSHLYANPGVYSVRLRVTEAITGLQHTLIKTAYVVIDRRLCTVPDFGRVKVSDAQGLWSGAGFTTSVVSLPSEPRGPTDYRINYQSIVGGTTDPRPLGCDSAITVGP